jgi:hypothetical protein
MSQKNSTPRADAWFFFAIWNAIWNHCEYLLKTWSRESVNPCMGEGSDCCWKEEMSGRQKLLEEESDSDEAD